MSTEFTEQIIREAPEIEAYKLALLRDARGLASQAAGLQQYDDDGEPIMESYDTGEVDDAGNPIYGQRPTDITTATASCGHVRPAKNCVTASSSGHRFLPAVHDRCDKYVRCRARHYDQCVSQRATLPK